MLDLEFSAASHNCDLFFFFSFVSILAHLGCMRDRSHVVVRDYLLVVFDRSCIVNPTPLFPLLLVRGNSSPFHLV